LYRSAAHFWASRSGLGRERRLRKRADFQRVQTTGVRVHAPHYLFLLQARPERFSFEEPDDWQRREVAVYVNLTRLGLVATKKLGNAVVRNRVKRVCRACFRELPDLLPPGLDLVVIPRAGAEALGFEAALAEWRGVARNLAAKARNLLAQAAAGPHVPPGR
jgi:ribonuclease P protein component